MRSTTGAPANLCPSGPTLLANPADYTTQFVPLLTRLYVKTAFIYLAASLLVAILAAFSRLAGEAAIGAALWPSYVHLLVMGWLTQLIFGVAFWLFPRFSRERPYGVTWPMSAAYAMLNGGLIIRLLAEPGLLPFGRTAVSWIMAASALLQWVAVVLMAAYTWRRVKRK